MCHVVFFFFLVLVPSLLYGGTSPFFLENHAALEKIHIPADTNLLCIKSYAHLGDSPLRWMRRLEKDPDPIQPWNVKTKDGAYWQDCGTAFYPEFLGATSENPDCSDALEKAFRAHLFLKMPLLSLGGEYHCKRPVFFDLAGFPVGSCDVDFGLIGKGRIIFTDELPPPCFTLASSVPQNQFWGKIHNLEILATTPGVTAQFGRLDFQDPSNNFDLKVTAANGSSDPKAVAIQINAYYSSALNIVGNGKDNEKGNSAVLLKRCNMCTGYIAAGHFKTGLTLADYTNGNDFCVDIEELGTGIVQLDKTCVYNELSCGALSNSKVGIDNHLGGPLRLGNIPIGGVKSIFANPDAEDSTWGGCGVTLDMNGVNPTDFHPGPLPDPEHWVMNKSGGPWWISFFGASGDDSFQVRVRASNDFTSKGTLVALSSPCGFILGPGEKVSYSSKGKATYDWSWRPLY